MFDEGRGSGESWEAELTGKSGGRGPLGREERGPVKDLSAGEKLLRYLKFAFLLRASLAETPLAENLAETV